jgi:glutamate dehydrogenase (NADP+)
MPTTNDALSFLMEQKQMIVALSKAVDVGGAATSALEMSQNSQRLSWSESEIDEKLHTIMKNSHDSSDRAAEANGLGYNLAAVANIARLAKVADAMTRKGLSDKATL